MAVIRSAPSLKQGGRLFQNGLFGIEIGEQHEGIKIHRLIMNLVPFNFLCVRAEGDVGTLPLMHPDECLAATPSRRDGHFQ